MFDAFYIGATGMRGQQMQIDAVAHNVANLNTVGFKRGTVSFAEIAAAIASPPGALESATATWQGTRQRVVGAGVVPSMSMSMLAGELKQTGNALDVAIDGVGYLEVTRADGSPAFTRSGQLKLTADGLMTTADGSVLTAGIEVPPDAKDLRITSDGRVTAVLEDGGEATEIGRIELVAFANPGGLRSLGDNLYAATAESGEPQSSTPGESGFGTLRQGFVEGSNVQMTDELVALMLAQRSFEMNSKVLQAADQMMAITNGLYR